MALDIDRLEKAYQKVRVQLMENRTPSGNWVGQLSSSALSTATTISAFSFYLETGIPGPVQRADLIAKIASGIRWLVDGQNTDGGWGDTDKSYSNISTTMLVEAALTAAGRQDEFQIELERGRAFVAERGGIAGLRARYGIDKTFAVPILANCAMAGLVPWKEVSALPFEAACVPQRFYNLMQLPVVSYAIPALVAIGQAKFVNDPPWNLFSRMVRKWSVNRSLSVLKRMQPSTGGFLEAAPLTGFVVMGLIKANQASHGVVKEGVRFLQESCRAESGQGDDSAASGDRASVPIDTNLATWVTTLAVNALVRRSDDVERPAPNWKPTLDWILSCQNRDVHPFTGAQPGGWGWSDLAGAVPDADDTPGAMLALHRLYDLEEFDDSARERMLDAVRSGGSWLLGLQNRDGGWPTFCRGWGKLPFDRSGMDLTAHVIRAFVVWRTQLGSPKVEKAIERGFSYLARGQREDGSWLPLWFGNQDHSDDENPIYGTTKVLSVYRDASRFDTKPAKLGLEWLRKNQNLDGGWGGGMSLALEWQVDRLGQSSIEETALATELLISSPDSDSRASGIAGLGWLLSAIDLDLIDRCSPIGFYFAKLWYYEKLYPLIFTTSALGEALAQPWLTNGTESVNRGSVI